MTEKPSSSSSSTATDTTADTSTSSSTSSLRGATRRRRKEGYRFKKSKEDFDSGRRRRKESNFLSQFIAWWRGLDSAPPAINALDKVLGRATRWIGSPSTTGVLALGAAGLYRGAFPTMAFMTSVASWVALVWTIEYQVEGTLRDAKILTDAATEGLAGLDFFYSKTIIGVGLLLFGIWRRVRAWRASLAPTVLGAGGLPPGPAAPPGDPVAAFISSLGAGSVGGGQNVTGPITSPIVDGSTGAAVTPHAPATSGTDTRVWDILMRAGRRYRTLPEVVMALCAHLVFDFAQHFDGPPIAAHVIKSAETEGGPIQQHKNACANGILPQGPPRVHEHGVLSGVLQLLGQVNQVDTGQLCAAELVARRRELIMEVYETSKKLGSKSDWTLSEHWMGCHMLRQKYTNVPNDFSKHVASTMKDASFITKEMGKANAILNKNK